MTMPTSSSGSPFHGSAPSGPSANDAMMIVLLLFLQKQSLAPYSLGELGGVLSLLPVNPSQCSLVQVINTNVTYFLYCRSCPYDRHDLYLPSIPASLQTLGRGECVAASAPASHGLRIFSPLTTYLNSLRAIWTLDKFFGSELSFHPSPVAS
jgi:hypothetical protein